MVLLLFELHHKKTNNVVSEQPNRSDTNRAVQAQKIARLLKFWIKEEEELYYPCSENKGAGLFSGYRICRLLVFPCGGSFIILFSFYYFCLSVVLVTSAFDTSLRKLTRAIIHIFL